MRLFVRRIHGGSGDLIQNVVLDKLSGIKFFAGHHKGSLRIGDRPERSLDGSETALGNLVAVASGFPSENPEQLTAVLFRIRRK